ncbi:cyclic nucleotide-binding protein [Flavobacterium johnsoniae UW101]|jgi:CRP-like cAMP-binding protein|uniref:Cyclic nucleotide-binding protein n=2 Tax=Flavobacteriaceae TaxID=49546 RepID=A5FDG9_FLAJ1|nr:cyclic nucleotide-binding protein [Flavobacterium johnsoniae UW101]
MQQRRSDYRSRPRVKTNKPLTPMHDIFKNHIAKFAQVTDDEFEQIIKFFDIKKAAKKENLLEEGQICRHHYFVLEGLLRKFYINEKGTEQTTEFAIETWWLTDNFAYENQLATEFYIQAVEKSTLLCITPEKRQKLLEEFPVMERYFRFVYQRAYAAAQKRIKFLFSFSKEEFYFQAVRNHPEFIQRVPQYLIASYLGFTPEYLSEIRRRLLS